jgi:hypothetical protein
VPLFLLENPSLLHRSAEREHADVFQPISKKAFDYPLQLNESSLRDL